MENGNAKDLANFDEERKGENGIENRTLTYDMNSKRTRIEKVMWHGMQSIYI